MLGVFSFGLWSGEGFKLITRMGILENLGVLQSTGGVIIFVYHVSVPVFLYSFIRRKCYQSVDDTAVSKKELVQRDLNTPLPCKEPNEKVQNQTVQRKIKPSCDLYPL